MSARIAPRVDTIGIAFSPHLPRFRREGMRQHQDEPDQKHQAHSEPLVPPAGFSASETEGSLPPELIFEAALLGNQQAVDPLTPYEMARRQRNEWSPPTYGFKLTDKTI